MKGLYKSCKVGSPMWLPFFMFDSHKLSHLAQLYQKMNAAKLLAVSFMDANDGFFRYFDRKLDALVVQLNKLVDAGNTVIMVEHNTDWIAASDWVIDTGPGGGTSGGRVVASGTPKEVAEAKEAVTGKFLA